jgi:hypothetical protein
MTQDLDELTDAVNRNTAAMMRLCDDTNRLYGMLALYIAAIEAYTKALEEVLKGSGK